MTKTRQPIRQRTRPRRPHASSGSGSGMSAFSTDSLHTSWDGSWPGITVV